MGKEMTMRLVEPGTFPCVSMQINMVRDDYYNACKSSEANIAVLLHRYILYLYSIKILVSNITGSTELTKISLFEGQL
jgi:hypothetical protein